MAKRFNDAVMKFYGAFHENRLNALDGCTCAVGNLCDNRNNWRYDKDPNSVGIKLIEKTGYSVDEIFNIESLFMFGCLLKDQFYGEGAKFFHTGAYNKEQLKEVQFKGLCAVVEYLAKLDNIPNPMDYSKLFETENDKPKHQLESVIQ